MPFNTLLLTGCFLPGKTSFTEDGVQLSLEPESGETVLFFSIDNQSNPNCRLRDCLGIPKNMKICDLIVFYAKQDCRIICFVELKGSDLNTAVEQVTNTYRFFKEFLNKSKIKFDFIAKAYIKFKGSPPQEIEQYKKMLRTGFGYNNYDFSRNSDLGDFIRGKEYKMKGKRKGKSR